MKVLIYSAGLGGHLQVYGRVIGDFLLEAGWSVTVAVSAEKREWASRWPMLRPWAADERVGGVDTRPAAGSASGELSAEQLIAVQREARADVTLLIDGDAFAPQFRRIAGGDAPRLRGRICAIFSRTSEWCPGEDAYTGRREPLVGPTLRQTLGRARRAMLGRRDSPRDFFERVLLRCRTVDALIVKDERIPRRHGAPVCWMPEIYRVFDARPEERADEDWLRFAEPVRRWIEQAGPANVLLYFGSAAWYKGYDLFLRLAQGDEAIFALHAGAPDPGPVDRRYGGNLEPIRQTLLRQGRLFETNAYIASANLMELLFGGISRYVSTHRLTLSSATALQALEMGRPVLTPDTGLLGWRTREFKLGATYAYGDLADLASKWSAFKTGACDPDPRNVRVFMERFSRERTQRFFLGVLSGESP